MDSSPIETIGQLYEENVRQAEALKLRELFLDITTWRLNILARVYHIFPELSTANPGNIRTALGQVFSLPPAKRRKLPTGPIDDSDRHPDVDVLRKTHSITRLNGLETRLADLESRLRGGERREETSTLAVSVYDELKKSLDRWPILAQLLEEGYQALDLKEVLANPARTRFQMFNLSDGDAPIEGTLKWLPKDKPSRPVSREQGYVQVYSFQDQADGEGFWVLSLHEDTSYLQLTNANGSTRTLQPGWFFKKLL